MPRARPADAVGRPSRRRRRRRLSGRQHRAKKLLRRGAFFRAKKGLLAYRSTFSPEDLGFADWLVFRRPANQYRPGSWASKRYIKAFEASRKRCPRPDFPPIA